VASPLAVPPAGVCGVLLGGIGVFVPSPVPIGIEMLLRRRRRKSRRRRKIRNFSLLLLYYMFMLI
jgi:hypothetical protein